MSLVLSCLLLVFCTTSVVIAYDYESSSVGEVCLADKLTVYRVVVHTFWTRDKFPKHYPDWKPPAQWSKVIGERNIWLFFSIPIVCL